MSGKVLGSTLIEKTLLELCAMAAPETMGRFRKRHAVENKLESKQDSSFDPVTEADKAAERAIRSHIIKHFPDHGILGEEQASINMDADYCWIIDPIDGTRAYISGLPGWGTLIGLNYKGKPIAGAMHQPFTGELYLADSGNNGSRLLHLPSGKSEIEHHSLRTSSVTQLNNATLMTTTPELFEDKSAIKFHNLKNKMQLTRYGYDCYAYCMVAAGHIELVVENRLNPYDIAPLIPIIEQAGGCVTNWSGGSAANGGEVIAAANRNLLDQAIAILAD